MKKLFTALLFAMATTMAFAQTEEQTMKVEFNDGTTKEFKVSEISKVTFTTNSSGEETADNSKIEINGTAWNVVPYDAVINNFGGVRYDECVVSVNVYDGKDLSTSIYYAFGYEASTIPALNTQIATDKLECAVLSLGSSDFYYLKYKSGKMTVVAKDTDKGSLTVKMDGLTMEDDNGTTFIFDGTAATPFEY